MKLLRFKIGDKVKLVVNGRVIKRGYITKDCENGYVWIVTKDNENYRVWVADLELDTDDDTEPRYTTKQVCDAIAKALKELGID